jgi:hypothetical protein
MRGLLTVLLPASLLAGCDNPCQSLCDALADYAEECGTSYSDAELADCYDRWADPSPDERHTCMEYGRPDILRREWTCDDVTLYDDLPK